MRILQFQVMIAKAFGRRDDSKLRGVTIVHTGGGATEQVRLPPGVTVHPGVRSKLPLGKRVRAKVSGKKGGVVSTTEATPTSGGGVDRKKRRRRRKEGAGPAPAAVAALGAGPPGGVSGEDPLGKVRNWLIQSNPSAATPPKKHMPKSKSTPAALQTATPPAAPAAAVARQAAARCKSNGSLQAKSKLQLLYKPPFKLTVKLNKKREEGRQAAAAVARGRTALLISRSAAHKRPEAKQPAAARAHERDLDLTTTVPSDRAVLISGHAPA